MISSLLISSYQADKVDAFHRLSFKAEAAFTQFERHWLDLESTSPAMKNDYLHQLAHNFKPTLHFSALTTHGKVIASSLNNLTQLSYGPVIKQFEMAIDHGQSCLLILNGLQQRSVSGCGFLHDNIFFIASLQNSDIFKYWIKKEIYFICFSFLSLLLLLTIIFLNHRQKQNSQKDYNQLKSNISKQDDDFKRLVSNLPGVLYRLKLSDQSLDYLSHGSAQLLGYPPEYFLKNQITPFDLIDKDDQSSFKQESKSAHFSLKPFEMVYRVLTAQKEHKWILDRGRCYELTPGDYYVEGVMLDITERELVRQQIEYLAVQDPLTELFNRFRFNDELVQAVSHAKMTNEVLAMLFIDLDRFKTINDSLGHQLGDRLLQKVAQRLQTILPEHHFLARMGGDEFVILMRNVKKTSDIETLANGINQHLRRVFRIDTYELHTSCSIGISICPEHSEHSHILWRYADTAMYQVKNRGGDGFQFFTQEMGDMVQHRINIEHSFIPSFENRYFELYYQPQVDINTNELLGCEALIRWFHPEMGSISPVEFIPIAEETGFIQTLGNWILEQCFAQLKIWHQFKSDFVMCINISAAQITPDLPNRLHKLLQDNAIPATSIELEITESLLMENIDYILPILNEIQDIGIRFAIDDFGTGYSSLSYLRYLPINKLKIDRAFVMNIENNQDDIAMVKAIVAMAKSLNLITLAEGIETESQLKLLQSLHCERYQGYYFNKPLDSDTFESLYMNEY
ncbi:hypothetical protein NBRC116188_29240 [Oceaniserpentilla sp. 4NH20-0058]